ncbi:MAG: hypothetical protein PF485_04465 [Bacteroidales bacterium]|jgi:hypothetical protein|nr:hypothetical protein [Bacteroidales bacterium]
MTKKIRKNLIFYKWIFINFLLLVIIKPNCIIGQNTKTDTLQISDTTKCIDEEFSFFMLDVSYTNNKVDSKDQTNEPIPVLFTDVSYFHKSGIWTGLMFSDYLSADSLSYDFDFQLGFQKYLFNDLIDFDINYTYHKFYGESTFEGIKYKHALNTSTGLTYEFIYLYADGNFYLDNENYFTNFGLSLTNDLDKVFFKNDYLLIQPTASVTYGTDYWLYDIYEPYIENVFIPILRFRGYPVENLSSEDIIERYLSNNGLSTNTYSYQGVDLFIPVTYGISNVSLMFCWMYYIPSEKLKAFGMRNQSGYFISLSFIF